MSIKGLVLANLNKITYVNYYKTNYISYAHPLMDDTNISTNSIVQIMSIMSFAVSAFILVI